MNKKILFILSIIVIAIVAVQLNTKKPTVNVYEPVYAVANFFPEIEMIKVFSGGFENSGMIHVVDKVTEDKFQVKQIDHGTGMIFVYKIIDDETRLVYRKEKGDGIFKDNYLDYDPNDNIPVLKEPIVQGMEWTYGDTVYIIAEVDLEVSTLAGNFEAIKINIKKGDFESSRYYAKGVGLIKISTLDQDTELIMIDYDLEILNNNENLFYLLDHYLIN